MIVKRSCACARLAMLVALPATLLAQPVIDGRNIPTDFGAPAATQRFQTGFGDDVSGDQFGSGSEMDQLFVTNDAQFLYIGITGNLENNGNSAMIFIDVDGPLSGANTLVTSDFGIPIPGLPRYLSGNAGEQGLSDLTFDAGFAADFVVGWSGGSPVGSQTRNYYLVNWTELDPADGGVNHTNTIAGMITSGNPTASGPNGTLGSFLSTGSTGILAAIDNANVDGVEDGFPPGLAANDPAGASTGIEIAIPLTLLGVSAGDSVCVMSVVSSPNGFLSNQMLPPDDSATEFGNLGFPPVDLGIAAAGDQFVCFTLGAGGCPNPGCETSDINGDCTVDLADLAVLLSNFGTASGASKADGDLDGDMDVDLADLAVMLADFGTNCN